MALLESMIKVDKTEKREGTGFSVVMVHYTKLIPSENNNYSVERIEELANSILLSGGIKQNLLARKKSPDEYELIAGHRRRLAVKYLVEVLGHNEFSMVPVHVEKSDDTMSEINLILTNSGTRERSDWEKMMEVSRLTELIKILQNGTEKEKERFRQIFGQEAGIGSREIRRLVAEKLGLSETKVANLKNIENNLVPELKEKFKEGTIGVSAANAAASLPVEEQKELAEKEEVRIADVKEKAVSESDTERKEEPVSKSDTERKEESVSESDTKRRAEPVSESDTKKKSEFVTTSQQKETAVPVFTLEMSVNNAYGWKWTQVVRAYLAEVHKIREKQKDKCLPETVFESYGREYQALSKGVQVVFLMEGEVQFIVDEERLNEEYDFYYPDGKEKISAYGTPKRAYPPDSLLTVKGCEGGHDCFSCPMNCQIRQEERYCTEASMGNPFPCEILLFDLDLIREEVGEKCQFINHDLAEHDTGSGEANPCCKNCKEPCEYVCGPAIEAAAERQQKEEKHCENAAEKTEKDVMAGGEELSPVREALRRESAELDNWLEAFEGEPADQIPQEVEHKKIVVAALAAMVTELEGMPETEQPMIPELKNNDQRKEWLRKYQDWGLWYTDQNIGVRYYKYDFDNGARLIVEEYDGHSPYTGGYVASFYHLVGGPEPPKHPAYGFGKWSRHETDGAGGVFEGGAEESMIVGTRKERTGGITQGDIEKVRKRVKIGDKVRIHTFKAADPDCMSSRYYGIERRGVVVGKYPHFAVVEFPGGTQESVLWVDFVKGAKGAGET